MRVIPNVIGCYSETDTILHRDPCLTVVVDLVLFQRAVAGEAQPEPVIGMVGLIPPIDVSFAKDALECIVGAIGCVVLFEEILIAAHVNPIGRKTCQEKSVTTQAGEIPVENVIA